MREAMRGRSWYAPLGFWVRFFLIMVGTVLAEALWASTGCLRWGVAAGVLHAWIGLCIQHDASHGAVSKNPTINALLAYGADWIGNSRSVLFSMAVLHPCSDNTLQVDLAATAHPVAPSAHQ